MEKVEKIKNITTSIKKDLENFEKELKKVLDENENFLTEDLNLFMFNKPKRLRPIFIFLFSKILNIKNENSVLNIAIITELLHNASLIHDDILDNEELRRGHLTFYKKYGSKLAVLEGDLLLSIALKILSNTNLEIIKIFSNRIIKTLNGEIEQNATLNTILDEETYFDKTLKKTGNLFLAGLESILTLDDFNCDIENNLLLFMKNYSLAFQIKNDIDNIEYKNSTDIKNGNYTLPVLYFCLKNNLEDIKRDNDEFKNCIEISKEKVIELKNKAINYIKEFDDTIYKKALIEVCNYTLGS